MQNWPQGDVATADASLHYYRSGGDLPPLVLVHGFTDHALYFTRVAETLTQRWDVIAYDQRGHGQSSRAQGRFDTALLADDLAAVVEALALDRPAVVGHSLGGAVITLALTTSLATRCRGAVLEDPFWLELPDEVAARYRDARAQHVDGWRAWVTELQRMPRAYAGNGRSVVNRRGTDGRRQHIRLRSVAAVVARNPVNRGRWRLYPVVRGRGGWRGATEKLS